MNNTEAVGNYSVHMTDIIDTKFAREWHKLGLGKLNNKQMKSILYLFGMDVSAAYEESELADGSKLRSTLTGEIRQGGFNITGYERKDKTWRKNGITNIHKFFYDDEGVDIFIKTLNGENLVE